MRADNVDKKERFYALLIVLLPVLSQYQVGPIDLDVILFVGYSLVEFLRKGYIYVTPVNKQIVRIMAYVILITAANILVGRKYAYASDIIFRTVKFCFYLFVVFFVGNERISYSGLMRAYRIVAIAAVWYITIQTIAFYGAGIVLPSRIGGFSNIAESEVGRLRAFYSEPAAMSYALVPFVACCLYGENYANQKRSKEADALLVTMAIILSTSGQGIIVTGLLWIGWLIQKIKNKEIESGRVFLIAVAVTAIMVIFYEVGILKFALDRAGNTDENSAISARMSGYQTLELLSPTQLLFGAGYGNHVVEDVLDTGLLYIRVNYSTIAQFVFSLGIVGTAIWVLFFAYVFKRGTKCTKMLVFALLSLSVAGCPMLPIVNPIWLTLICVQLPAGQFSRSSLG